MGAGENGPTKILNRTKSAALGTKPVNQGPLSLRFQLCAGKTARAGGIKTNHRRARKLRKHKHPHKPGNSWITRQRKNTHHKIHCRTIQRRLKHYHPLRKRQILLNIIQDPGVPFECCTARIITLRALRPVQYCMHPRHILFPLIQSTRRNRPDREIRYHEGYRTRTRRIHACGLDSHIHHESHEENEQSRCQRPE